jgi:Ca2+-transporting ATPase
MDDAMMNDAVTHCRVFARVSPEHKVRIVTALQSRNEVVAMTGDGVNDAPSLKKADVGVAMGITGTDVSREASDIILTDDNFATIVAAVEEGRTIYDNIRKFVRYTLATNLGEVLTMFIAMVMGMPLPMLAIQILWINLVTDGLPALALGVEPAEGDVMRRPPRPPHESLFARGLLQHIIWVGLLMSIATLVMFHIELDTKGELYARTMAFYTIAVFQLFHVMAIRRERESAFKTKLSTNWSLTLSVVVTLGLQLVITYVTPIAKIFKNVPISVGDLLLCTAIASSVFFAVEIEKHVRHKRYKDEA